MKLTKEQKAAIKLGMQQSKPIKTILITMPFACGQSYNVSNFLKKIVHK